MRMRMALDVTRRPLHRRRFQFRLRTLFLLALIVALYGSLGNSLEGLWRIWAVLLLTILLLGILYWKRRLYGALTIVYGGPILSVVMMLFVATSVNLGGRWLEFLILGEAIGIVFSSVYAARELFSR